MQRDRGRIDLDLVTLERSAIITRGGERRRERRYFARPSAGEGEKKRRKRKRTGQDYIIAPFFGLSSLTEPNQTVFTVLGVALEQMLISLTLLTGRERKREREELM